MIDPDDPRTKIAHRRPPAYPYEAEVARGGCAMCGEKRPTTRRRYCSEGCGQLADYPWGPRFAAYWIARDTFGEGVTPRCFECGLTARQAADAHGVLRIFSAVLELDHSRPLWSLSATERLEIKWWLPGNLALLCHWCHAAKTAREAKQRAALARTAKREAAGQVALL